MVFGCYFLYLEKCPNDTANTIPSVNGESFELVCRFSFLNGTNVKVKRLMIVLCFILTVIRTTMLADLKLPIKRCNMDVYCRSRQHRHSKNCLKKHHVTFFYGNHHVSSNML
jgi:hypothetical protein